MKFTQLVLFLDAIRLLLDSGLLPTSLGSRDLAEIDAELLRHSTFSAKTTNARYLEEIVRVVSRILEPDQRAGQYMDKARAREELRSYLQFIGYTPDEGKAGTLQDLSSDARIDLVVRMNVEMAQGYAQHIQANDPQVLNAFPCQELFRIQRVAVPRQQNAGNQFLAGDGYGGYYWPNKWRGAGGKFYGGGRMIARKDDPIWTQINRFGNPYPPFDYNSGMWVKPVGRYTAVELGVIGKNDRVAQSPLVHAKPMQTGIMAFSQTVLDALQRSIPGATIKDGVLTQEAKP